MADLAELHRLNAEATQKIIAKRLCNLMDDEWKLGRGLYMEVAKEILVSIEFPELLAKAEAHDALVAAMQDASRIMENPNNYAHAFRSVRTVIHDVLVKLGGRYE